MNWNNIKEKYPKAIIKATEYFKLSGLPKTAELLLKMNLEDMGYARILYSFFDDNGIYVQIHLSYITPDNMWFEYTIDTFWEGVDSCSMDEPDYSEPYKTRTRIQAEEQAFMKAFEILENKL